MSKLTFDLSQEELADIKSLKSRNLNLSEAESAVLKKGLFALEAHNKRVMDLSPEFRQEYAARISALLEAHNETDFLRYKTASRLLKAVEDEAS